MLHSIEVVIAVWCSNVIYTFTMYKAYECMQSLGLVLNFQF